MDTVQWFKKRAKKVLKAIKAGDEIGLAMVSKFRLDSSKPISLMTVQHCVAKGAGFNSWRDLISAPEAQRAEFIDGRNGRRL